jgi:hypothetical protein
MLGRFQKLLQVHITLLNDKVDITEVFLVIRFKYALQLINAWMLNTFQNMDLSEQSLGSEVVRKDLFEAFAGIVFLTRHMRDLHNFAISPLAQLLDFLELRRHLEILVQLIERETEEPAYPHRLLLLLFLLCRLCLTRDLCRLDYL